MAMRRPRSPLPRCAAPAGNVWIGTHHAPGEEHARREGERERAEKDEPGALRSIERRIDSSTGVSTNTSQPSGAQSMMVVLSADYPIA